MRADTGAIWFAKWLVLSSHGNKKGLLYSLYLERLSLSQPLLQQVLSQHPSSCMEARLTSRRLENAHGGGLAHSLTGLQIVKGHTVVRGEGNVRGREQHGQMLKECFIKSNLRTGKKIIEVWHFGSNSCLLSHSDAITFQKERKQRKRRRI